MKRWKLLLFASALCIAPVLAACGDDEGNNNNNPTDGGPGTDSPIENPDGSNPTDGGGDSADGNVDTTSFPKYVKSLIELKTDDKGTPDLEAIWTAIPDDDKFVFPTAFFP